MRQFKKNLRNTGKRRKKNWQAINDETKKTSSDCPCWNNSIDNIYLESIEEFKNSLEKLKLNWVLNLDAKKLI
jgi:archaellum component FlaC